MPSKNIPRKMTDFVAATPLLGPFLKGVAGTKTQRLLGFWFMWHAAGGLKPLLATGWIARSGIYAQQGEFAQVFGCPVDDFLPELALAIRNQASEGSQG